MLFRSRYVTYAHLLTSPVAAEELDNHLLRCGGCRSAFCKASPTATLAQPPTTSRSDCSRDCQKGSWPTHRSQCASTAHLTPPPPPIPSPLLSLSAFFEQSQTAITSVFRLSPASIKTHTLFFEAFHQVDPSGSGRLYTLGSATLVTHAKTGVLYEKWRETGLQAGRRSSRGWRTAVRWK